MSAGGQDLETILGRQVDHRAPEPHDFRTNLRGGLTHRTADFDDRLVQLRLDVLDGNDPGLEDLGDEGLQLAVFRVDDLVLLLDSER